MKKAKLRRAFSMLIGILLVIQMMPVNFAMADDTVDITGSDCLVVHGENYDPSSQASSLKITQADGTTEIPMNKDTHTYSDIPAGARIFLRYAFNLKDGDGKVFYDYDGNEFFTATLPEGINFVATSGTLVATDTSSEKVETYNLAEWSISGNKLTVSLNDTVADRKGMWGVIEIGGTFSALNPGDGTDTRITFGGTTIIIKRQPLPMKSTLTKSYSYDASKNEITWTVNVTVPTGDPNIVYDGYSVIDEYGENQAYVDDSFEVGKTRVGTVSLLDTDTSLSIDKAHRKITYTFPAGSNTKENQTIKYKTKPTTFANEDGSVNEDKSVNKDTSYNNKVSLMRGTDSAADPVTSTLTLDWITKSGAIVNPNGSDPSLVKWTVKVNVPGVTGKSITGAKITDKIPPELMLVADKDHPVSIMFGSTETVVSEGTTEGTYDCAGNELTYRFPSGKPTSGTDALLMFYTRVTDSAWSTYLNSNSAINFNNSASLSWNENDTLTTPSDSAKTTNSIPGSGLIGKSAVGGKVDYTYSASDPGTIQWTITVNRNKIDMKNAVVTDNIPTGQKLLIDDEHHLVVNKAGEAGDFENVYTMAKTTNLIPIKNTTNDDYNKFTYSFPEESTKPVGSGLISSTYTIKFYTRIIDTTLGASGDSTGLDTLYKNSYDKTVDFKNNVSLDYYDTSGTKNNASASATKPYNSQMVEKTVDTQYNYIDRTVKWKIVINRNRLPLTESKITDTLPSGMSLLIDAGHKFDVTGTSFGGESFDTLPAAGGNLNSTASGFTYKLPTPTTDQYTITFWTLLGEDTLKTQWSGDGNFNNTASLSATEIKNPIEDTEKVSIYNPVISKSYQYTKGDDTIKWSVIVNPAQVQINNGAVEDALNSSLKLDPNTVNLYTVSIKPDGSVDNTTAALVPLDKYTVTLPTTGNNNTLKVTLPPNTKLAYRLDFSTQILTNDIDLSNSVKLTGSAGEPSGGADSQKITVTNLYSNAGSGSNKLVVKKTDASGNPLKDAVFQLLNADKQPIIYSGKPITAKSDGDGKAIFENLPSWVFYVKEIEPAPGYLIPADPYWGGGRLDGTDELYASNSLALKDVTFYKKGAGGVLLSGGEFTLTGTDYASNSVSITSTADKGTVTFANVPMNKSGEPYLIKETKAPTGHDLNPATLTAKVEYNADKTDLVVTVSPDTMNDAPYKATVSFTKTAVGGAPLSGGEFTLTGTDYAGGNVNKKVAAASDGTVSFDNVPVGSYEITETAAPDGYLIPADSKILTADVVYNEGYTAVTAVVRSRGTGTPIVSSAENVKALGTVTFTKKSAAGGVLLSGGKFTLTGKDYASNSVSITSSAESGTVKFDNVPLNKSGEPYTITETEAPTSHELNTATLSATVQYNASKTGVITAVTPDTLTDVPYKTTVSFTKTAVGGAPISGGTFTLTGKDYSSGDVSKSESAASDGTVSFTDVPIGSYVITETVPPNGYLMPAEPKILTANVIYNSDYTAVLSVVRSTGAGNPLVSSVENVKAVGTIEFSKISSSDNKPLSGGSFVLTGKNFAGEDITMTSTSIGGKVTFTDVPLGDDYTIKEETAPSGYVATGTLVKASVKYNDSKTAVLTSVSPDTLPNNPYSSGTLFVSATVVKTDESGNKLQGATFKLYNSMGTEIATAVSGSDGRAVFDHIPSGTGYSIKETKAPDGYELNTQSIDFNIYGDLTFTMVNKKMVILPGTIDILKTGEDGKPLAGAEFTLYNAAGSKISSAVTGSDGHAVFTSVQTGTYTLTETKAPDGYKATSESKSVKVESGSSISLTFVNTKVSVTPTPTPTGTPTPSVTPTPTGTPTPTPSTSPTPQPSGNPGESVYGSMKIAKVDKNYYPLSGAVITLYNENWVVITTAVSGSDGLLVFDRLAPGIYTVQETTAPQGYRLFTEPLKFEIGPEGTNYEYTLRDVLETDPDTAVMGWNNTKSVSGGKLPQTGGIPGSLVALLAGLAVLVSGIIISKPKRRREKH